MGLSIPQAKVYFALVQLGGISNANEIFKFSSVARQDVYRILTELQKLGLVEKIIDAPIRFRSIPIQVGVSVLLERKSQKLSTLQTEARKLIEDFAKNEPLTITEKEQFVLIPEREPLIRKFKKTIEATYEEICVINTWREFVQWSFLLSDQLNKIITRNVNIRWLTDKVEDSDVIPKIARSILNNPRFKLRIVLNPSNSKFAIFDGEEVIIATQRKMNAADSPALWSNNPALVSILKEYFDRKWKSGIEYKPKK